MYLPFIHTNKLQCDSVKGRPSSPLRDSGLAQGRKLPWINHSMFRNACNIFLGEQTQRQKET